MDAATRNGWLIGGGGAVCAAAFAAILYQAGVFSPPKPPSPQAVQAPPQPSKPQQQVKPEQQAKPEPQAKPEAQAAPVQPQTSAAPQAPAPVRPSFDVVRVEPNGDAVIAGRAAPGAKVTLMISGKPGAQALADNEGQFVMLPQALPPGAHDLALRSEGPKGAQTSKQTVAVSVPERPVGKPVGEVVVALAEPDKPTVVLSKPVAAAPSVPAPPAAAASAPVVQAGAPAVATAPVAVPPAPALRIESVEADDAGGFYASGKAAPGQQVRLYLNGAFVADIMADVMGRWSLRVSRGLQRGKYAVRADAFEGAKVAQRAEVEFDYAPAPGLAAPQAVASRPPAPAPVIVPKAVPAPQQAAGTPAGKQVSTVSAPVAAAIAPQAPAPAAPAAVPAQAENQPAPQAAAVQPAPVPQTAPAHVVIEQLRTASVVRGDSLWRISRRMLGQGVRYTQIYAANSAQVRNPHRIYPGQVLVVPNDPQRPAANGGG